MSKNPDLSQLESIGRCLVEFDNGEVCDETVKETPSGSLCYNGHGGAPYGPIDDISDVEGYCSVFENGLFCNATVTSYGRPCMSECRKGHINKPYMGTKKQQKAVVFAVDDHIVGSCDTVISKSGALCDCVVREGMLGDYCERGHINAIIGNLRNMTPKQRVIYFREELPQWPDAAPYVGTDNRLYGMWIMGNDYRNKTRYWGAYPPNYLRRVMALFPDKKRILHLFSGSLPPGDYTRFDRRNDAEVGCVPDVQGEAEELTKHFKPGSFDLIIADPPYTEEDANKYGTSMCKRNVVLREAAAVLDTKGHIVWLDMMFPMFTKKTLSLYGCIGMVRSTNHRFRVVTIFERVGEVVKETPTCEGERLTVDYGDF